MDLPPTDGAWLERNDGACVALDGNCALGRSSSSTVIIPDAGASRHHAAIHVQDAGEFWLIDLGSINGTQLNDRRVVRPVRLKDADRIGIAETMFIFHRNGELNEASRGPTLPTAPQVREETRWLLLADIENFTPLSQQLPRAELAALVGKWVGAGRKIVEGHGGSVNKYLGDGYLACWPENAETQVAAAVLDFRALRERAEPKFRIVVHRGTITVGGAASLGEDCLMGPEVNFLFRVEKAAGGAGAAFCFTAGARERIAPHLVLEPIAGRHELKGFAGDCEFFQMR